MKGTQLYPRGVPQDTEEGKTLIRADYRYIEKEVLEEGPGYRRWAMSAGKATQSEMCTQASSLKKHLIIYVLKAGIGKKRLATD